jgi:hypothetical protein
MESREDESRTPASSQPENEPQQNREHDTDQPMLYCPVCNHRLISRRCKLICEQCGYFMSCADYY